jgi:hypothetical protein
MRWLHLPVRRAEGGGRPLLLRWAPSPCSSGSIEADVGGKEGVRDRYEDGATRPASRATAHRSGIGQPRHRRLPFLIRRAVTFLFPFLFFWYSGNFPVSGVCRFAQLRSQIRAGLSFVFGHGQHGQLDTMCDPVGAAAHSWSFLSEEATRHLDYAFWQIQSAVPVRFIEIWLILIYYERKTLDYETFIFEEYIIMELKNQHRTILYSYGPAIQQQSYSAVMVRVNLL